MFNKLIVILLFAILVIPINKLFAFSQQSIVITQTSLSILPDRTNYFVNEPIHMQIDLTYNGQTTVTDTFMFRLDTPNLNVYYRRLGENNFLEYGCNRKDYKYGALKAYPPTTISPNEEILTEEVLAFDTRTNKFVLDKPGIYEFKAVYKHVIDDPNQWVESETILIETFIPSEDEKLALELYSNEYVAKLVQRDTFNSVLGVTATNKAINEAINKSLVLYSRYPNSIYSKHLGRAILDNKIFSLTSEEPNQRQLLNLVHQNQWKNQEQNSTNRMYNNSVGKKLLDSLTPSNYEENRKKEN